MPEVVLKVDMMCEGCEGAVKRVLGKMEGVTSFEIILSLKKVIVRFDGITQEAVIEKVAKTGKATELWKD